MAIRIPGPRNSRALVSLMLLLSVTAGGIFLSLNSHMPLWVLGQMILTCTMWAWFSVLHSCGHRAYFKQQKMNSIVGHLASLITFVPFFSWKHHHNLHHRWTGWKELDPSSNETPDEPLPVKWTNFFDLCWKLWLPIFSLSHAMTNFWNPIRMNQVLPDRKRRIQSLFSQALIVVYIGSFLLLEPVLFLKIYGLSLTLFLVMSDPVLLSQHIALPVYTTESQVVKPFKDHNKFCRTITFGKAIDRMVLLNFNLHSVHHEYPSVAHYDLHTISYEPAHHVSFTQWVKWSKSQSVRDLIWPNGKNGEKHA